MTLLVMYFLPISSDFVGDVHANLIGDFVSDVLANLIHDFVGDVIDAQQYSSACNLKKNIKKKILHDSYIFFKVQPDQAA